jgi:predicted CXXCH cytochrome family protein
MQRPARGPMSVPRAARRIRRFAPWVVLVGAAVWSGCTVTPRNYKVLSFFFDGVPDPSIPPGAVVGRGAGGKPTLVVVHKPFAEERCEECHTTKYRPSKNDSSICLKCHAAALTQYQRMHGPVAAAACLWCHSPHESAQPHLLRSADPKVCLQCHAPAMLESTRVAAHADESRACLDCHSGHGSDRAYILKPGVLDAPPSGHSPGGG